MSSLDACIDRLDASWGPLSSELIGDCRRHLEALLEAQPEEPWLAKLHKEEPANEALYRDPKHGFMLLAHMEYEGLYRPPHDHGRSWGIYCVQSGASEMSTFVRIQDPDGSVRLVRRDTTLLEPGQVKVFLPGDIHDTRCVAGKTLLFRFTERDLKKEDRDDHQVTRYVERDGVWTVDAA